MDILGLKDVSPSACDGLSPMGKYPVVKLLFSQTLRPGCKSGLASVEQ
jgi:hypothetical protein